MHLFCRQLLDTDIIIDKHHYIFLLKSGITMAIAIIMVSAPLLPENHFTPGVMDCYSIPSGFAFMDFDNFGGGCGRSVPLPCNIHKLPII